MRAAEMNIPNVAQETNIVKESNWKRKSHTHPISDACSKDDLSHILTIPTAIDTPVHQKILLEHEKTSYIKSR